MTQKSEVVEEKSGRRLKTDQEKVKDQQALSEAYNRLMSAVENAKATHVGPEWDHDKGIVGKWRYPHLRKGND